MTIVTSEIVLVDEDDNETPYIEEHHQHAA